MAFTLYKFKAPLNIIGINPFVFVPGRILAGIFQQANKDKGHIPVKGEVNGKPYKQTLVRFRGEWRLYINTIMLNNSPKRIGELLELSIVYDPDDRALKPHPKLTKALKQNPDAKTVFNNLPKSRKQEIIRYISFLKTEKSVDRNIERAINFLLGKTRFAGRDKP